MAGAFPDVPGVRFEYDRDGSVVTLTTGAGATTASLAQMQEANDEDSVDAFTVDASATTPRVTVAWPEVRDLTGLYLAMGSGGLNDDVPITVSTDTTNGLDGAWTALTTIPNNRAGPGGIGVNVSAHCRTNINAVSATGIRGVAFTNTGGPFAGSYTNTLRAFHIYGQTALTQNPNRLVLCDGTGTVTTNGAYLDFGDSPRATQATIPFRIRNNSASLTANSVAVSFECLYNAAPSLFTQFDYSINAGASWITSHTIASLGPGAATPQYLLRRNTAAGAAAGPWQLRLLAVPASMT
jgi:hypothetical protein